MAVLQAHSYQFLLETIKKEHDLESDTIKIALMDSTFSFNPSTHATWTDVSSDEIADGSGYTSGGETLTSVSASINSGQDRIDIAADNVTWTASGGAIPTTGAAIIYNDSHANKTVVKCIDFGADYDTADGKLFQINFDDGMAWLSNTGEITPS